MKLNLLFGIAAFMILTSCNDFYFKNPQPLRGKELKVIPKELVGNYVEIKENDSMDHDTRDALVITRNSYDLKKSDDVLQDTKMSGTLESGKVVLKEMDDFYVLSQKVKNPLNSSRDSVWEVYILEYKNDVLTLYNLASEERALKVDSVKQITPVNEQQEGDKKYYLINPTNKQFKKLLLNNLYTKVGKFKKLK